MRSCCIRVNDPASLRVIAGRLRPGGLLAIDNMLWPGRIFDETDHSGSTEGVRMAARTLTDGLDWISTLRPIHDGLMVARRSEASS
jgi:caffeoyl-CoA O-methyltransferase